MVSFALRSMPVEGDHMRRRGFTLHEGFDVSDNTWYDVVTHNYVWNFRPYDYVGAYSYGNKAHCIREQLLAELQED